MAFEQKDLTGALFKNKDKERSNHPDYRGSCTIDGMEYWISAWINTPKSNPNGEKYMSLNFQEKEKRQRPGSEPTPKGNFDNFDDDIPF